MAGTLRPKYVVHRLNEEQKAVGETMHATDPNDPNSPFVIFPRKDPAAFHALLSYAAVCEKGLRAEILLWAEKIAVCDPDFGTQGARNWQTVLMDKVKSVDV